MKPVLLLLTLIVSACASHSTAPLNIRLRQDVLQVIDGLTLLAKGIEATAEAKVITTAEAHDALDVIAAAISVLRRVNAGAYDVLSKTLMQIERMSWSARIRKYLDLAKILLAALHSPQVVWFTDGLQLA